MHDLGYSYTGRDNLYQLTWNEILRLLDGTELIQEDEEDRRFNDRDLETLESFDEELQH